MLSQMNNAVPACQEKFQGAYRERRFPGPRASLVGRSFPSETSTCSRKQTHSEAALDSALKSHLFAKPEGFRPHRAERSLFPAPFPCGVWRAGWRRQWGLKIELCCARAMCTPCLRSPRSEEQSWTSPGSSGSRGNVLTVR